MQAPRLQPRRPQGVPTGGQFAEKARPAPATSIGPDEVAEADRATDTGHLYSVPDDIDTVIPQANSPEKIVLVVDAIAGGYPTTSEIAQKLGVVGRQGGYYTQAAKGLGLITEDGPGWWMLTERGAAVARSDNQAMASFISQAIDSNEHVQTYTRGGADALRAEWDGISGSTVERRISTIESWLAFSTALDSEQLQRITEARGEVSLREVRVTSRKAAQQRPVCENCHVALPTGLVGKTTLCEDCQ